MAVAFTISTLRSKKVNDDDLFPGIRLAVWGFAGKIVQLKIWGRLSVRQKCKSRCLLSPQSATR